MSHWNQRQLTEASFYLASLCLEEKEEVEEEEEEKERVTLGMMKRRNP